MLPGDHVTDEAGRASSTPRPATARTISRSAQKHGLPMTHNVLEDGSFRRRPAVLRRGRHPRPQGQGGRRQQARHRQAGRGRRADRARAADAQLSAQLAVEGAADLPQHAAMVRRHRQAARRRHVGIRRHDPAARADLDRRAGDVDAALGPQPPARDDRAAPGLGAEPPARLGRAADLFRARARQTASRCCGTTRSTAASSPPSARRGPMPGSPRARRSGSSAMSRA